MDYMEGNLEPDQKTLVEVHLLNCLQCREHFQEIQCIGYFLKSYTVSEPEEAFWDKLSSRIYSRVNTEKPTQRKPWDILQDWMTWKRLMYTAAPILLILLVLFPIYPHFVNSSCSFPYLSFLPIPFSKIDPSRKCADRGGNRKWIFFNRGALNSDAGKSVGGVSAKNGRAHLKPRGLSLAGVLGSAGIGDR
jgi:hypothetical protein